MIDIVLGRDWLNVTNVERVKRRVTTARKASQAEVSFLCTHYLLA